MLLIAGQFALFIVSIVVVLLFLSGAIKAIQFALNLLISVIKTKE